MLTEHFVFIQVIGWAVGPTNGLVTILVSGTLVIGPQWPSLSIIKLKKKYL